MLTAFFNSAKMCEHPLEVQNTDRVVKETNSEHTIQERCDRSSGV